MASTGTAQAQRRKDTRTPARRPSARVEPQNAIQDHALIGDLHTAALVAKDGSIDFLCLPDFDSDACFAALLGTPDNGRWKIAPKKAVRKVERRYRGHTMILETDFHTDDGVVRVIDLMPIRSGAPRVVRIVEGIKGEVPMTFALHARFANGYTLPRESTKDSATVAIAGPDAIYLRGGAEDSAPPFEHELTVRAGQRVRYELAWARPYDHVPGPIDCETAIRETEEHWVKWAAKVRLPGEYQDLVMRSLMTLKACTYRPSGAIVAAPTFGLPESPGGERNWDYRFTWLRDSVLTLHALLHADLVEEGLEFASWFEEAIGGNPDQLQIMYGIRGERRLTEIELPWLEGYGGAKPVRIGNGAFDQFQLDVLGEVAAVLFQFAKHTGTLRDVGREAMQAIAMRASEVWQNTDHGIWEMRGPTRSFVASKVAAWTATDRWIRTIELLKLDEDPEPWKKLRQQIHDEVCDKGFDTKRNTFTQYYGSKDLDASLLFIATSGFLPATDPRFVGTVKAIEEDLIQDGLVLRYRTDVSDDGLSGEEGTFLACSFWLANAYHMIGRKEDARKLFERVAGLCNDVGLLAEEYLPKEKQQTGNFPQAFSHLALVNCAYTILEDLPPPQHPDA